MAGIDICGHYRPALLFAVLFQSAMAGQPLSAQTVEGRVVDLEVGIPISWAYVALVDSLGGVLADDWADGAGRFSLEAPAEGQYDIYGQRIGYLATVSGPLVLEEDESIAVELTLRSSAVTVEGVTVTAEVARLGVVGYYDRKKSGLGTFLDGDRLEAKARGLTYLSHLFRGIPRIQVSSAGIGAPTVLFSNPTLRELLCTPEVYVDGRRSGPGWAQRAPPDQVSAVEIYRGASEAPAQFAGTNAGCGVILIWLLRTLKSPT